MDKATKSNHYHYNSALTKFAQINRRTLTKSAACLWKYVLSRKQMMGYQFRRERPILHYIADFACLELMLVIEVDGGSHLASGKADYDRIRDYDLLDIGFTTLRFSDQQVLIEIHMVREVIASWIENNEISPDANGA